MSLGQEIPIHPWTKLATDIIYFEGESYLLLVDYTSWFPIVHRPNPMAANGLAEMFVQIVKNLFHKAREEGADLYKVFMIYRNTPLSSNLQSQSRCFKAEL